MLITIAVPIIQCLVSVDATTITTNAVSEEEEEEEDYYMPFKYRRYVCLYE